MFLHKKTAKYLQIESIAHIIYNNLIRKKHLLFLSEHSKEKFSSHFFPLD